MFTPIFFGACIHIPDPADIGNPGALAVWMAAHAVTVTHLTPAMGQLLTANATAEMLALRVCVRACVSVCMPTCLYACLIPCRPDARVCLHTA